MILTPTLSPHPILPTLKPPQARAGGLQALAHGATSSQVPLSLGIVVRATVTVTVTVTVELGLG